MSRNNPVGATDLIGRSNVSKADARIEALGAVDEAAAALAFARGLTPDANSKAELKKCQAELSVIMGALAGLDSASQTALGMRSKIQAALERLMAAIRHLQSIIPNPQAFVLAGESPASGALDMARTVVRRAERRVVQMYAEQGPNDELILEYLNKLSTLVYMLELSAMQEEID